MTEPRLTALAHGGGCGCKLAPTVLSDILGAAPAVVHPALLVDAATSDDAAVWRISDETAIVATTDFFTPIVDDPADFGRIAAANALSDIYAMGGTPIFALAIVGMPIGKISTKTIRKILDGGAAMAAEAGAVIAGGHSIDAAEPIYGLAAIGLVHPDRILRNSTARAGDVLILGKPLGIGIFSAALKRDVLTDDAYAEMISSTTLLNTPGAALSGIAGVHAATDVTGFGLLGHLAEMCRGSGLAARMDANAVPIFDAARSLAEDGIKTGASARNWESVASIVKAAADWPQPMRDLFCDPQTSGGLLVACAPEAAEEVLALFVREGHCRAAIIGEMVEGAAMIEVRNQAIGNRQ